MPRPIEHSVVVITGASSGIGKATAHAFADRGARLVLGARRQAALQATADECNLKNGEAVAVPVDITEDSSAQKLVQAAEENFGGLDVWVNNAGVLAFGRFEEMPVEVYRRVIETDLLGYVYGMRAALPVFRQQGHGVIVNVSSVVATAPQPYTSAYVGTQFAVRGIADSIRMELELDEAEDVHVCTLKAASIDTPFLHHAANYTGRPADAMEPVYPAEQVAEAIVSLAEQPRPEVIVGKAGRATERRRRLMPRRYERKMAETYDEEHLQHSEAPPTEGNLFEPKHEHTGIKGGWRKNGASSTGKKIARTGAALAIPALLAWALRRSSG